MIVAGLETAYGVEKIFYFELMCHPQLENKSFEIIKKNFS